MPKCNIDVAKEQSGQLAGGDCCCMMQQFGGFGGDWFGGGKQLVQRQLTTLRSFRDNVLRKHRTGVLFTRAYYGFSRLTVPRVSRDDSGIGIVVNMVRHISSRIAEHAFGIK